MANTSAFGPAITQATQSAGGGGATYDDVVQTPFDVGLSGREVVIIDSIAKLEVWREDGWQFSSLYPTRSRYKVVGNGVQDVVLDLEGISHTLRHPIELHDFQRNKVIAVEQQFRESDQTGYPYSYPSVVCPNPPLGGAMALRIAPAGECKIWLEGGYMNGYDPITGRGHSMDAVVWRGNYCNGDGSSWLSSEVYIQNYLMEGLEGSNKQPGVSPTTAQKPEIHNDSFQTQGANVDALSAPRKLYQENVCYSGSMGGINLEYGSKNGITTDDDEWEWQRNVNMNLTDKYSSQYRSGSGVAMSSSRFRDYTPANFVSKGRIYHENVKHSRYSEYYFGTYGQFLNKNLYVAGWNQSFGDPKVYTDPGVEWYSDHTTWGPDPAWEFITEPNVGGSKYTSPHTHNHR